MKQAIEYAKLGCILAGLGGVAVVTADAAQVREDPVERTDERGAAEPSRLALKIKPDSKWSYLMRRPEQPQEDGARGAADEDPGQAADKAEKAGEILRLDFHAKDVALDDEGQMMIVLSIRPAKEGAEKADDSKEAGQALALRIDREGRVLAIQPADGKSEGVPALPIDEVRTSVEWILGAGLHDRALEKGARFEIGGTATEPAKAAPAKRASELALPLDRAYLLFDRASGDAKSSARHFAIHRLPESGEPDAQTPRVGEVSYSAADGMLLRLVCQKSIEPDAGRKSAAWLIVERLEG
jgi:hypothetical protein